jgi:hypothetical protein
VGWLDIDGGGVSPKDDGPSLGAGVGTVDGKADSVFEGCCDGSFDVDGVRLTSAFDGPEDGTED